MGVETANQAAVGLRDDEDINPSESGRVEVLKEIDIDHDVGDVDRPRSSVRM